MTARHYVERASEAHDLLAFMHALRVEGPGRAQPWAVHGMAEYIHAYVSMITTPLPRVVPSMPEWDATAPEWQAYLGTAVAFHDARDRLVEMAEQWRHRPETMFDFGEPDNPARFMERVSVTEVPEARAVDMATPRQIAFLKRLTREAGMLASEVEQRSAEQFGKSVADLRKHEISMLIEAIQREGQTPLAAAT